MSHEEQRKSGYSLPSQLKLLREKMKNDCVEEVEEPIEDVESGRDFERKGLKKVLELAHDKRIDYVYVYDLDRLGRHVAETPYLMYRLKEEGVVVSDIKEEYNFDDPMDYVIVTLKCARAHSESLLIGERTQRGKNEKFLQGKWVGPLPFAYRKNAKDALERLPEFKPIVYDIFITYKTLRDVKRTTQAINERYLNKIGRISINQLKTILKKPVYIGGPRYGKTRVDAPELAMIPSDLFAEVQSLMETKARRHKPKEHKKPRSVLDKFASEYGLDHVMVVLKLLKPICPKCGALMVGDGSKPYEDIRLPNFRCTSTDCGYQRTIPLVRELEHFRKKLLSCPKCRSVEDFVKTMTLSGSTEYTCRRCGTSFQFTAKKESERADESPSTQKSEEFPKPEQLLTATEKDNRIDPHHLPECDEKKANKPEPKTIEIGGKGRQADQGKSQTLDYFWSKPSKIGIQE